MELNQDDKKMIQQWVETHAPQLRCFCCGGQQWEMGLQAGMTVMYDTHTGRIHYMDGYPMVALVCKNCAHIVWFSAPLIGLSPQPPKAEEKLSQ